MDNINQQVRLVDVDTDNFDDLIKLTARELMEHIINNGYELCDCLGVATTWAKWSTRYFNTDFGYVDAKYVK